MSGLTLKDIWFAMSVASARTRSSTSPSASAVLLHTPHTEHRQLQELQVGWASGRGTGRRGSGRGTGRRGKWGEQFLYCKLVHN